MPSLSRSRAVAPELVWRPSSPSTNAELLALAAESGMPSFTVLATDDQTAGRGRLDRVWQTPPGAALAVSVLLRPRLPTGEALGLDRFGWLPLAAGVAMAETAAERIPRSRVALKWPNDVLVGQAKLCGVLAELLPSGDAVVVGAGVNLAMTPEQAPVPSATSFAMQGVAVDDAVVDEVLAGYLTRLRGLVDAYAEAGGDADASGLRERVLGWCSTMGRAVRVELPGGEQVHGTAVDVDAIGRLLVDRRIGGGMLAVAAGDVTHLRYE